MKKIALSWSGGKDSLMALLALEAQPDIEICALVTTVTDPQQRISMHGVHESLLDAQAAALELPLVKCRLPAAADNNAYRENFAAGLTPLITAGMTGLAFGDLFLEDVREFREAQMRDLGLEALFPIWDTPTDTLANAFIALKQNAVLCCIDSTQLSPDFVGREYDTKLLRALPDTVDPCGENGEFHTFAYASPRFGQSISFNTGEIHIAAERFHFLDLI